MQEGGVPNGTEDFFNGPNLQNKCLNFPQNETSFYSSAINGREKKPRNMLVCAQNKLLRVAAKPCKIESILPTVQLYYEGT